MDDINDRYLRWRREGFAVRIKWDIPLTAYPSSGTVGGKAGYTSPDLRFDTYQPHAEVAVGLGGSVAKFGLTQTYSALGRDVLNNNGRFDISTLLIALKENKWFDLSEELEGEERSSDYITDDLTTDGFFRENISGYNVMRGDNNQNVSSMTESPVQYFPLRAGEPEADPLDILDHMKNKKNMVLRLNSIYGPRPMHAMLVFAYVFDLCVLMKSPQQSWLKPEFIVVGKRLNAKRLAAVKEIIKDRTRLWYSLFIVPQAFVRSVQDFKNVVLRVSEYYMKRVREIVIMEVQKQIPAKIEELREELKTGQPARKSTASSRR